MDTRTQSTKRDHDPKVVFAGLAALATPVVVLAAIVKMTLTDFHVPGSQVGDLAQEHFMPSYGCSYCHAASEPAFPDPTLPHDTWSGTLMAQAGRDPLFYAQMALAEQDVTSVGYYCMRCHVPHAVITGHANVTDGAALDEFDRDGVSCHFCHSMVDPVFDPGSSPPEDESILKALADKPQHYGNAMFVLDPLGTRRGVRLSGWAMHEVLPSPFHKRSDMCGTCHDVGNVATTRLPDGSFAYNAIGEAHPTGNPHHQFPLERTFTEWRLSAFAKGGVDMHGRFGGVGVSVVSSCQDCHMPRVASQACVWGPEHADMAMHDFSGAAVGALEMVKLHYADDPGVNPEAIDAAKKRSIEMLAKAASLQLAQVGATLRVRVVNECGHKFPTGHIEGRRAWVNVRLKDSVGGLLAEFGGYDLDEAELDAATTEVYEMLVGLSPEAAELTGLPAGETAHMALANIIVKDNRIPPRGFGNDAFEAGGAPVVAHVYADGQHWDDSWFAIPPGAATAEVSVYYQNLPRRYIEHLRDHNTTNDWGMILHDLWLKAGRGEPNLVASATIGLAPAVLGDLNVDGLVDMTDLAILLAAWGEPDHPADLALPRGVHGEDLGVLLSNWGWHAGQ